MKHLTILMACMFISIFQITNAQTPPLYPWKTLGFDSTYLPGQLHLKGNLKLPNGTLVVGADTIAPSAAFEVTSFSKGILIPRLLPPQFMAIPNPKTGLLIYNLGTNQFNYYNGSSWVAIGSGGGGGSTVVGTPKQMAYYNATTGQLTSDNLFRRDSVYNYSTTLQAGNNPLEYSLLEMDSAKAFLGNLKDTNVAIVLVKDNEASIGHLHKSHISVFRDTMELTFQNAQSASDSFLLINRWGALRKSPYVNALPSGLSGDVQKKSGGTAFGAVTGLNVAAAIPGYPVLNVHSFVTNGGGLKVGSQGITIVDPNGYNIAMIPPALSTSDIWTLPSAPGADKQVLTYTTGGNLAWKYLKDVDTSIAQLKFVKVTLDSTQLQNCFSSPVQLLAAPGLGKAIEPIAITHRYRHLSSAYSVSGSVNILQGSNAVYSNIDLTTASTHIKHKSLVSDINLTVKTGLSLSATSSNPAFGNGSLDIYITYKIIDL